MTLIFAVQPFGILMYILADNFNFLCRNVIFGENTKAIVHGFVKKWCFLVGNGIKPFFLLGCTVYIS